MFFFHSTSISEAIPNYLVITPDKNSKGAMMVSVTKNNQITIPKEVREDLDIHPGDKVVFAKDKEEKWVLMTLGELTDKMVEASSDIEETIEESRKGFKNGVKRSIQSLGGKD